MRIISDQHFNTPSDISFFVDATKEFLISREGVLTGAINDKRTGESILKNAWYGDLYRDRSIIKINNQPLAVIVNDLGLSNNERNRETNALKFFSHLQAIYNLNGKILEKFLLAYNQAFLCVSRMLLAVKLEEIYDMYFTPRLDKDLTEISIEIDRVVIHNYFNIEKIFSNFDPERPFILSGPMKRGHYDIEEILELKLDHYQGFKVVEIKVNNPIIENFIDTYFPNSEPKIFNLNFVRSTKAVCFENLLGTIAAIGINHFGLGRQQFLLQNVLEKYRNSSFFVIAIKKLFNITDSYAGLGKACNIAELKNYRPWLSRFLLYTMFFIMPIDGNNCLLSDISRRSNKLMEDMQQNLLMILKIEIGLGILPPETTMHKAFSKEDLYENLFFV